LSLFLGDNFLGAIGSFLSIPLSIFIILLVRIFVFPARFPPLKLRMEDPKAALFLNEGIYDNLGISYPGPSSFDIIFSYPLFLPTGEESFGEIGYYLS